MKKEKIKYKKRQPNEAGGFHTFSFKKIEKAFLQIENNLKAKYVNR